LFFAPVCSPTTVQPEPVLIQVVPHQRLRRIPTWLTALLDGLNALGLTTATAAQVLKVTEELFPQGTKGMDQAEVLRAVFLHLKRQNQGGNAGR
jgi:hypothetical protein